jgi:hypothetical protein
MGMFEMLAIRIISAIGRNLPTLRAETVKRSLLIVKLMSNKWMTKLKLQILNKNKSAYVPDE